MTGIENTCTFEKANTQPCYIDLSAVTSFEWDEVFEFEDSFSIWEINKEIGFDCKCEKVDSERHRVLFTKDGEIVKAEEYEMWLSGYYFYPDPNDESDHIPSFTSTSSVFEVKRTGQGSNVTYTLHPVDPDTVSLQ